MNSTLNMVNFQIINSRIGGLLVVLCYLLPWSASSQSSLQDLQDAYPGFSEVVLAKRQKRYINVKNDQLEIMENVYYESQILDDQGIQDNFETFVYSGLVPVQNVLGWTVVPGEGREKKIPVTNIVDLPVRDQAIFADDLRKRKLTFTGLEVGARKVFNYTVQFSDPYLLHRYVFGSHLPTMSESFEVVADKGVEIGFQVLNDQERRIQYERIEERRTVRHIWSVRDLNAFMYEEENPGYLHFMPHVVMFVRSYPKGSRSLPVLGSVGDLYRYYKNFIDHLNMQRDDDLFAFTRELVRELPTDHEKMKAIYYWVKSNIKYVAFESGYEGFIPREASIVFRRRFGDCKDYASLLTTMASYAGIPDVHMCWIGTRELPYSYNELATPSVDNHMIAVMKSGDQYFWLDGTDTHTGFGWPSGFIQGKEALVSLGDTFEIVRVPVVPSIENQQKEEMILSLSGGVLEGAAHIQYSGLMRSEALAQIISGNPMDRRTSVKGLLTKGNDTFYLVDFSEEHADDLDRDFSINYAFHLDKHVVSTPKADYVSLFLDQPFLLTRIAPGRYSPYDLRMLVRQTNTTRFRIPQTHKLEALPPDFHLENDLMSAHAHYSMDGSDVVLSWEISNRCIQVDPGSFDLWNATIDQLKIAYSETLCLKKL